MFLVRMIIVSLPLWTKLFNILIKIMNFSSLYNSFKRCIIFCNEWVYIWGSPCLRSDFSTLVSTSHQWQKVADKPLGVSTKWVWFSLCSTLKDTAGLLRSYAPAGQLEWLSGFLQSLGGHSPGLGLRRGHPPLRSWGPGELHFITYKTGGMQHPCVLMLLLFLYVFFLPLLCQCWGWVGTETKR